MSRKVQLVLLCEDSQHEAFARRFLRKMGWATRQLRIEKAPGGRGSGEQFVRERFPLELFEHRRRPVEQALVVLLDGDATGTAGRLNTLNAACIERGMDVRRRAERVAVFVPTWRIETWFAYLDGTDVDEDSRNYPKLERERRCQRHVDALSRMCVAGQLRQPAPPSLKAACIEYNERLA